MQIESPYGLLMTKEDMLPFVTPTIPERIEMKKHIYFWRGAAEKRFEKNPSEWADRGVIDLFHRAFGRMHQEQFMTLAQYMSDTGMGVVDRYYRQPDYKLIQTIDYPIARNVLSMVQAHHNQFMNEWMTRYTSALNAPTSIENLLAPGEHLQFRLRRLFIDPWQALAHFYMTGGQEILLFPSWGDYCQERIEDLYKEMREWANSVKGLIGDTFLKSYLLQEWQQEQLFNSKLAKTKSVRKVAKVVAANKPAAAPRPKYSLHER